ncbi:MAG: PilZ domain-containing protein [Deltaproteobacteria bacterium]|nr:PilZ domain-containing protein [Deltaproteobacteria bacterium]
MGSGPYREKREHRRIEVHALVRLESELGRGQYWSKNLSAGGVFLLAEEPLPEETRVSLELYLPGLQTAVSAEGEVVWQQRQDPAGFAVRFLDISQAARDLIRLVITRIGGSGRRQGEG